MGRMIDADALEVITAKVPKGMDAKSYMAGMEYVLSQIDALPTIEERKTGKWVPHKSIFGGLGELVYTCDQCGYNIGFHSENFCPKCGSNNRRT